MKKICILLMVVILCVSFVSCKSNEILEIKLEGCDMTIHTNPSVFSFTLLNLEKNSDAAKTENQYNNIFVNSNDMIMELTLGGFDAAVMPISMAYDVYNKTNGNLQIMAIVSKGGISFIGKNSEITSFKELDNKTLYLINDGTPIISCVEYLLYYYGISCDLEVLSSYSELCEKFDSEEEVLCVTEDFYSKSLKENDSNIKYIEDINYLWKSIYGSEYDIPMQLLCVNRKFSNANPGAIEFLYSEMKTNTEFSIENSDAIIDLALNSDNYETIIPANEMITENSVCFIADNRMQDILNDFYNILKVYEDSLDGQINPSANIFVKGIK